MTSPVALPVTNDPTDPGNLGAITLVSSVAANSRELVTKQDADSEFEVLCSATNDASKFVALTDTDGGPFTVRGPGTRRILSEMDYFRTKRTNGTAAVDCKLVGSAPASAAGQVLNLGTKTVGNTSSNGILGHGTTEITAADVDGNGSFIFTQTTAGITAEVPAPSSGAASVARWFGNASTSVRSLTLYGRVIQPNQGTWLVYNGTTWAPDESLPDGAPARSGMVVSGIATTGLLFWSGNINVYASKSISQTMVDTDPFTNVTDWSELYDTAAAFDPATGLFTAPVAGYYAVSLSIEWVAAAAALNAIYKIRMVATSGQDPTSEYDTPVNAVSYAKQQAIPCAVVFMALGETIRPQALVDGAGLNNALGANGHTNFLSISLITQTAVP